jgi:arsenate reductase
VKKARAWLAARGLSHSFHDFKKSGVSRDMIEAWLADVAWDVLLNRKGTTWRALPEERKALVVDARSATELMLQAPAIIKRPVLRALNATYAGFSEELYQRLFQT